MYFLKHTIEIWFYFALIKSSQNCRISAGVDPLVTNACYIYCTIYKLWKNIVILEVKCSMSRQVTQEAEIRGNHEIDLLKLVHLFIGTHQLLMLVIHCFCGCSQVGSLLHTFWSFQNISSDWAERFVLVSKLACKPITLMQSQCLLFSHISDLPRPVRKNWYMPYM